MNLAGITPKARDAMRKAACVLAAFVLTVSFIPMVPQGALADEDGGALRASIEELLAAGDYVEGEALAIVRSHAVLEAAPQAEQLAEVSADSVEMAAEDAAQTESALDDEAALRVQSEQDDAYEVRLVVDHGRTTEQILLDLYGDPDVIAAEPNYRMSAAEAFGDEGVGENEAAAPQAPQMLTTAGDEGEPLALTAQSQLNPGDLTSTQWSLDDSLSTDDNANTPLSPTAGYSMNVPGWAAGRTDRNAPANASGTVCIMDMGIDADHPDLKNLLYEFTEEQQATYHCGLYGYNASGDDYGTDVLRPSGNHGTHVAGIVAAEWNGEGTSGVAHGVKIFCVNVFGGIGTTMVMSSVVKGFQFLVDVAQDVNLKAVNCSWGIKQPQFVLTAMVNELGKKGVNTVIAAGNDHENLDETIDFSSETVSSPYSITVNAAMPNGKSTEFSCYGQTSTDVFAPGSSIMSTVPVTMSTEANRGYAKYALFYPQATDASALISYDSFGGDVPSVRVFDENPAIDDNASEIPCEIAEGVGFGDRRSLAISVSGLHKQDKNMDALHGIVAINGYAYLAIPIESPEAAKDVKWAAVTVAMSDAFKPVGALDSLTFSSTGKDGAAGTVEVDAAASIALDKGWQVGSLNAIYQTQWSQLSYDVDGLAGAYSEAHARMAQGEEFSKPSEAGAGVLQDLGEIGGLCVWQDGEQPYVIARIGIGAAANSPSEDTLLYVDDVALGTADACGGAYLLMPGTSMAAPAVAGCLAVIAKDETPSKDLSDEQLELQARERAAKLLASVEYDDDLATLCRTGGRVDLAENPGFAKKAPLLESAVSDGQVLTIYGSFFGERGSLEIDGFAVEITEWSDTLIKASMAEMANGSHVAKVTNGDGAVSRIVFSHSGSKVGGVPLYENTLAVPADALGNAGMDRLWGPLAGCDGFIYAQAASARNLEPQGLWRYDIEKDAWSRCSLPEGYGFDAIVASGMVAYRGSLYLYGPYSEDGELSDGSALWRYDSAKDAWTRLKMEVPLSSALCVYGDDLLFVGGSFYNVFGDDAGSVWCATVDVDKRALEPIEGSGAGKPNISSPQVVASQGKIYSYAVGDNDVGDDEILFYRLTFDRQANTMACEDMTEAFEAAEPPLEASAESSASKVHVALAGLPDGVAIICADKNEDGSYVLGQDTHVIYDDGTAAEPLGRTSSYHRAFDPLATFYNGRLYAAGCNATEPDAMYFRSTQLWDEGTVTKQPTCTEAGSRTLTCLYREGVSCTESIPALGHDWGAWKKLDANQHKRVCKHDATHVETAAHTWNAGKVTTKATAYSAGARTYTCMACKATKTESIPATVKKGSSYKVDGSTYKVTSSTAKKRTVTLTKAKAVKNTFKVPKAVEIKGASYKVTAIGSGALDGSKATKITVGDNVTSIGAKSLSGAKKAKTVVLGVGVAKIAGTAFKTNSALKILTVKTTKLTKSSVKNSLKGSKIVTVKVPKSYLKDYTKFFAKPNSGKNVAVRAI